MKTTIAAVIAKVASAIPALSGKVWLDHAKDGETLPYAVVKFATGGAPAHYYGGNHVERAMFSVSVYGTDAPTVGGYQDTVSAAFEPPTKLTLSVGHHLGTWSTGVSLPKRGIDVSGNPCYVAENRYRIESTRA